MFSLRLIVTIASVVLMSVCAAAQSQTEARVTNNETSETPRTGSISGKVINESGQPLMNASVFVRAIGSNSQGRSVNTDREGSFQLSGLEQASYQISASMPSYTTAPRDPDTPAPTYRLGDSVTLTLIKGGVITGTVLNAAGEPVVAIGVRAQMIREGNGRKIPIPRDIREVASDDRGIYRIYGLPSGTYLVVAGGASDYSGSSINVFENDVPTYAPSSNRDTAAEINVRAGEETTNIDIRYRAEPGHRISGIANGATGPNSGYSISLTAIADGSTQSNMSSYQYPEARGFSFTGVADGDYQLMAQSSLPGGERLLSESKVIKVRGADVTGIELTTRPVGSVSGRIVLEESKAPECTDKQPPRLTETLVSAWHNDNEAAKRQPSFIWSIGAPVSADADGNVLLRNLAPGQYYFIARLTAKYWYLQSISLAPPAAAGAKAARPIDATHVWTNIKAGERLTGLTITLAQGAASLRGQLSLGEGEQQPPRLYVYLVPAEREKADELLRFYAAPVSPEGKLALNNIAPGRYWIVAQTFSEDLPTPLAKLRLPHETETRAKLRREAEAAKNEIELKPCQNVADFKVPLKP